VGKKEEKLIKNAGNPRGGTIIHVESWGGREG